MIDRGIPFYEILHEQKHDEAQSKDRKRYGDLTPFSFMIERSPKANEKQDRQIIPRQARIQRHEKEKKKRDVLRFHQNKRTHANQKKYIFGNGNPQNVTQDHKKSHPDARYGQDISAHICHFGISSFLKCSYFIQSNDGIQAL